MSKQWFAVISVVSVLAWSVPIAAKQGRGHGRGDGHGKGKEKAEKSERAEEHRAKPEKQERAEEHGAKREKHERGTPRAVATRGVGKARTPAPRIVEPVVVIDRDGHRRIVTQYFTRESLPPGLARRQSLPPGLQRQLRERGHLPPGLQKRLVIVPGPLVSQLPPVPPYYTRYFAGRDLIVVDTRTNTIVNVIRDVLARL